MDINPCPRQGDERRGHFGKTDIRLWQWRPATPEDHSDIIVRQAIDNDFRFQVGPRHIMFAFPGIESP
jgi:hypothetical protein